MISHTCESSQSVHSIPFLLAETHTINNHTFDIRAEVGLLSRNVVVQVCNGWNPCSMFFPLDSYLRFLSPLCWLGQGDAESYKCIALTTPGKEVCTRFGGHIFLHSPGSESLTGRIENVELRNAGQVCFCYLYRLCCKPCLRFTGIPPWPLSGAFSHDWQRPKLVRAILQHPSHLQPCCGAPRCELPSRPGQCGL
jgi:hypothetical protein